MVLLRIVAIWLTSLLFAFAAPTGASVAASPVTQSPACTYDNAHSPLVTTGAAAERGPPASPDRIFTDGAVDRRSHGASARPDGPALRAAYDYGHRAPLAQVARAAATTQERARAFGGDLSSITPDGVAAKYGDDVAETAAKACSFSGATLVLMADGTKKPIQDIKVGDMVLATDPETGEQVAKRVEDVFVHDDALTDLALADGTVLTTTEDHPYWSVDDQRFERADELSSRERVLGADGRTVEVAGLRLATTRYDLAYNLSVEGIHTYHVGADAVLVHNTCPYKPNFDDPSQPPGEGWEWRGPPDKGSWFNPATRESLHPDLSHPEPIGPHYDWRDPLGTFWRIFRDGTVLPK